MAKQTASDNAIQADKQAWDLRQEAYRADRTYSPPGTLAQAHTQKIVQRTHAQADFVQKVADYFGRLSTKKED